MTIESISRRLSVRRATDQSQDMKQDLSLEHEVPSPAQSDEVSETPETLAEQVLSHVKALRRYALLLCGNRTDADDMVQETMTRVLARTSSWRQVKDMRSYLFATLHNTFIDHKRKQQRIADNVDVDAVISSLSSPAAQMKRLELRDLVAGLAKLPSEQREVVLLVGLEGMSYQKASETLGVPIGTVMSRLSRGREALRVLTNRTARANLRVVK